MSWKKITLERPISFETGGWDGKRSDQVLVCDKNGIYHVARMYEWILDGTEFEEFYGEDDVQVKNVEMWMYIPNLF